MAKVTCSTKGTCFRDVIFGGTLYMQELEITTTWTLSRGLNQDLRAAINNGLTGVRLILKGKNKSLRTSIYDFYCSVRKVAPNFKIMVDLPGGKPRLGNFIDSIFIEKGQLLSLSYSNEHYSTDAIPTEYLKPYSSFINVGDRVLVNDGCSTFEILSTYEDGITIQLVDDFATLMPNRSINLPDSNLSYNALTDSDIDMLAQLEGLDINMVAISMVSNASDVVRAKELLLSLNLNAELIAKIETPEALSCLPEISVEADSMMIARGDLTTLCGEDNLFAAQVKIIKAGRKYSKSLIGATGLLASLGSCKKPSISEICDASFLLQCGLSRFLLADGDLCFSFPNRGCAWLKYLYSNIKILKE